MAAFTLLPEGFMALGARSMSNDVAIFTSRYSVRQFQAEMI